MSDTCEECRRGQMRHERTCSKSPMAGYWRVLERRSLEVDEEPRGDALAAHLRRVGVPHDRIADLSRTLDVPALAAARRAVLERRRLLLLIGPTGIGKTVAASFVVQDACRRWPWNSQATGLNAEPAAFVEAARLSSVSAFEQVDQQWLRQLQRIPLLVLDDVGDEGTTYGRGLVATLLMQRHSDGLRSVVTSNLTTEAFRERYGTALLDRVRADGLLPDLGKQRSLRGQRRGAA